MGFDRNSRLSEEIRKTISSVIQNGLKDPRIPMLTSITNVDVTKDLKYAKVFVSVYGDETQKAKCIEGLKSSAGFIRKEIGANIKMRHIPELTFELDNSIEYGLHISKILNEINSKK
jgi:ribosome-binding factor A